jgi:Pyruvate/2-oxoacid:ferredoxin oxidoreductase gamma subunit
VILGRKGKAPKKVLGVKIPGTGGSGFDGLADNVGNAAKQLGKLASEVREARQRAEKVGKALS